MIVFNLIALILISIVNIKSTNPINLKHFDISINTCFFIKSSFLFYVSFYGLPSLFCTILKKKYNFDNIYIKLFIYTSACLLFMFLFFTLMGSGSSIKYFYFTRQLSYAYYENLASISAVFKFISFMLISILVLLVHSFVNYLKKK